MQFKFTVPGKGVAKERPRFNSSSKTTYTPERTQGFEAEVAWRCREAMKKADAKKTKEPVCVEVTIYRKRKSKEGYGRPMDGGDVDNIAKSILDAMNKIAYDDDKQVTTLTTMKRFTVGEPHITIYATQDIDFE